MSRPSVRETIAVARARMADDHARSKSIRGGREDELEAFKSSNVPGVKRTPPPPRRQTDVEILGHTQKSIKSLIANAKATGTINISSRDLKEVPLEVWNMFHVDPDKIVVDFNSSGGAWYNDVDLSRIIASDNRITFIDGRIQEFGALVGIDFHSNELTSLPDELEELKLLVNLHLSSNKFTEIPRVVFNLSSLLELQFANNLLSGSLDASISRLNKLEMLDISGNQLTNIPEELAQLRGLRRLNLSKNKLEKLPVSVLASFTKLIELDVSHNKLANLFFGLGEWADGTGFALPALTRLDARNSTILRITDIEGTTDYGSNPKIDLPILKELLLTQNNLSSLENLLFSTPQLQVLDLRSNRFTTIPEGVLELESLHNLDMTSNRMEYMPTELANMTNLTTFVWENNPIRNVPRTTTTTEALMKLLKRRQETDPPAPADTARVEALTVSSSSQHPKVSTTHESHTLESSRPSSSSSRTFAAPVAVTASPSTSVPDPVVEAVVPTPPVSQGPVQNLNLSKKELKELTVEQVLEASSNAQSAILDLNMLTAFPEALHAVAGTTLMTISMHHNKISEFPSRYDFPLLVKLDLSHNLIPSLVGTLMTSESAAEEIGYGVFPNLAELVLTSNKLTEVPTWLRKAFPKLKTFVANRNKITKIEPESFEGLISLDLSDNEIGALPPLLGHIRTIKSLNVDGNVFRFPRRQVMEQGTESVMEYLRGRIPA